VFDVFWVLSGVEKDTTGMTHLRDIQRLKVPNWKTLVQDRRRWKEVVEKAKTLH